MDYCEENLRFSWRLYIYFNTYLEYERCWNTQFATKNHDMSAGLYTLAIPAWMLMKTTGSIGHIRKGGD